MQKIAVCVSGGGTNLQAIIDAVHSGKIHNTQIAVVISNKADAYALERANNAGIPALCISPKEYENRSAFETGRAGECQKLCAGYCPCGAGL